MNIDLLIVISLAAFVGLAIFFSILAVSRVLRPKIGRDDLDQLIADLRESEISLQRRDPNLPAENSWSGRWYKMAIEGGGIPSNPSQPGILALGMTLLGFAIGFLVWPGTVLTGFSTGSIDWVGTSIGGFLLMPLGPVILAVTYSFRKNTRLKAIDKQLPNLLSGIRASLKADLTPQQALMEQSKEFPAPLGLELRKMTDEMSLGLPMNQALRNFADRTSSRELKFLVSAISIAIASGADLDPQIKTIQEIVIQRTRIANHLATAISRAQPAIWVTGLAVPLAFIWSFYSSETNKEFWLSFPFGILCMLAVAIFYGAALVVAYMQVKKIKNS